MKTLLAVVISLIVGFLVAFVPMTMKSAELKAEIETSAQNLDDCRARAELAELELKALSNFVGAYEAAMNKNYGIAQTRAIAGFDVAEMLSEKGVAPYPTVVTQRDELVSILAKATDDAQPKMRLLLFSLYKEK